MVGGSTTLVRSARRIYQSKIRLKRKNKEESWYTHKHLHQAATHLINAIPHLFSYLNDEQIPKSTNQIEGYFSHLKEKLTLHRGLRFDAKKNFINGIYPSKTGKAK